MRNPVPPKGSRKKQLQSFVCMKQKGTERNARDLNPLVTNEKIEKASRVPCYNMITGNRGQFRGDSVCTARSGNCVEAVQLTGLKWKGLSD